jgi:hypothetical protein
MFTIFLPSVFDCCNFRWDQTTVGISTAITSAAGVSTVGVSTVDFASAGFSGTVSALVVLRRRSPAASTTVNAINRRLQSVSIRSPLVKNYPRFYQVVLCIAPVRVTERSHN